MFLFASCFMLVSYDGGDMLRRNVGWFSVVYKALYRIITTATRTQIRDHEHIRVQ